MNRKLIIDGNAVYELDEECMLRKRQEVNRKKQGQQKEVYNVRGTAAGKLSGEKCQNYN